MDYGTLNFLLFVAAAVLLYYITPKKFRWAVLLAASGYYYFMNSRWLVVFLFANVLITFAAGLWMGKVYRSRDQELAEKRELLSGKERKELKADYKTKACRILTVGIVLDLGMLIYLKYYNFLIEPINKALSGNGFQIPLSKLLLPIGISFYTLQAMAYLFDVYREKYLPDRNIGRFLLFMSFFPQLLQGPIARYEQLANQLYEGHPFSYSNFTNGIQLALWGFMKKMIIADRISPVVTHFMDPGNNYQGSVVLFGALLYGLQIYTDFSGGIDISRGIAQVFGVTMAENFEQPYFARSLEEFWRRWHMSLGNWMRDYVFYPLSLSKNFAKVGRTTRKIFGSYVGKRIPAFLSMFIVYFFVGIWHGANTKYIAYGFWNGFFIAGSILLKEVYEKLGKFFRLDGESIGWKLFQIVRTYLICSLGRYFPIAKSTGEALLLMKRTAKRWYDFTFLTDGTLIASGLNTANWVLLIFAVMVLFLTDYFHEKNVHIRETIAKQHIVFRWLIYFAAVACLFVFGMYGPAYDKAAFIYEQF